MLLWALLLFSSEGSATAVSKSLIFCKDTLIPSLFPFLILSEIITSSGIASSFDTLTFGIFSRLFRISAPGSCAFLLGSVSGFPIGAKTAAQLYQKGHCTKEEAERLIAYSNNASPSFIIAAVGGYMLNSISTGILLYFSQILASIITGVIIRPPKPPAIIHTENEDYKGILCNIGPAIASASVSMLKICGSITAFSVVLSLMPHFISGYAEIMIKGIIDFSEGVLLTAKSCASPLDLSLISFFCGFSGLSVLFQVFSISSSAGLSMKYYLPGKLICGLTSAILTFIAATLLKIT